MRRIDSMDEKTIDDKVYEAGSLEKPKTLREGLSRHLLAIAIIVGCGALAHHRLEYPKLTFREYTYEQTPDYVIKGFTELRKTIEGIYQSEKRLLN